MAGKNVGLARADLQGRYHCRPCRIVGTLVKARFSIKFNTVKARTSSPSSFRVTVCVKKSSSTVAKVGRYTHHLSRAISSCVYDLSTLDSLPKLCTKSSLDGAIVSRKLVLILAEPGVSHGRQAGPCEPW